jgi:chemotaxis protein methyltransferase CheR
MSLLDQLNLGGSASSGLSDAAFEELRRFIYERTGIYFRDNKRYLLESRLKRRVEALGLDGFDAYVGRLRSAFASAELTELVNAVTINETYFFRHADQHEHFVRELLPTIVEERLARGQRRVRIWSAACSTGDEPYTLALLILEHLQPRYPHVTFEIVGTDIDTDVVARARRAVYGTYAVRNVPPALLAKYFTRSGTDREPEYTLSPRARNLASFRQANLADEAAMRRMRDVDAIFCANVLIYFDQAAKERVTASLYGALRDGGYLFVGVSETLYGVTQAFQPVRFAQSIAYRKEPAEPPSRVGTVPAGPAAASLAGSAFARPAARTTTAPYPAP